MVLLFGQVQKYVKRLFSTTECGEKYLSKQRHISMDYGLYKRTFNTSCHHKVYVLYNGMFPSGYFISYLP